MPYNKVTLLRPADAETVEKKSRFIGHAAPVKSEAEAMSFVEKIRAEYSDATHNVWAYYLNGGASARCSDDGEPQGSSGYPTLNALKTCGADDLCVVVTRYFGGTLLGTAGLARTYAAAARAAIDEAGFGVYLIFEITEITVGYSEYQKLTAMLKNEGIAEENTEFGENVRVTAAVPSKKSEKIASYVYELCRGEEAVKVIKKEERLFPIER